MCVVLKTGAAPHKLSRAACALCARPSAVCQAMLCFGKAASRSAALP